MSWEEPDMAQPTRLVPLQHIGTLLCDTPVEQHTKTGSKTPPPALS